MQCSSVTGINTQRSLRVSKPGCPFFKTEKRSHGSETWKNCSEFLPVIILRSGMVLFLLLYPGSYKRRLCCVSHLNAFAEAGAGRPQGRAEEMLR